jgi:hypothetical protein
MMQQAERANTREFHVRVGQKGKSEQSRDTGDSMGASDEVCEC